MHKLRLKQISKICSKLVNRKNYHFHLVLYISGGNQFELKTSSSSNQPSCYQPMLCIMVQSKSYTSIPLLHASHCQSKQGTCPGALLKLPTFTLSPGVGGAAAALATVAMAGLGVISFLVLSMLAEIILMDLMMAARFSALMFLFFSSFPISTCMIE